MLGGSALMTYLFVVCMMLLFPLAPKQILQIRVDRRQVAREVMKQSQRWRARMSSVQEKSGEK